MESHRFDEFEAIIEAKGKAFTQEGSGLYLRAALRNDLVSRLNKEVTEGIEKQLGLYKINCSRTEEIS